MVPPVEKLRIIAQPRESYRERYESEQNKIRYAGQRYIRAGDNENGLEYPTIEIPKEWLDASPPVHIRVASVTMPIDEDMTVCVHPYPIDSDQPAVLKDPANNALYFPVTNEDVQVGYKSFHLARTKLLQSQLKAYGALRVINSNKKHTPRTNKRIDGKRLIQNYQLWKSQLLFSQAEHVGERVFNVFPASTVSSQIMSDEMYQERAESPVHPTIITDYKHDQPAICVPNRGEWTGDDNLLMDDTILATFDFIYMAKDATPTPVRPDVTNECPSIPSNSSLEIQCIDTNNNDESCANLDHFFSNHDLDWL